MARNFKVTCIMQDVDRSRNWSATKTFATVGNSHDARQITVGTTEQTVTFDANVGNAYYLFVRNLDSTNPLTIAFATTASHIVLRPGDVALFPLAAGIDSLFMKASTAAVEVEYALIEE